MAEGRPEADVAPEELAAARALVAGLTAQLASAPDGLRSLRAEYERLALELARAREECAGARDHLAEVDGLQARAQRELEVARAELDGVRAQLDGLGPVSLGVARRLHAAAARFPVAGRMLRTLLRAASGARRRLGG